MTFLRRVGNMHLDNQRLICGCPRSRFETWVLPERLKRLGGRRGGE